MLLSSQYSPIRWGGPSALYYSLVIFSWFSIHAENPATAAAMSLISINIYWGSSILFQPYSVKILPYTVVMRYSTTYNFYSLMIMSRLPLLWLEFSLFLFQEFSRGEKLCFHSRLLHYLEIILSYNSRCKEFNCWLLSDENLLLSLICNTMTI